MNVTIRVCYTFLLLWIFATETEGVVNLFQNADFESSDYSDNWFCKGSCTLTQSSDAYRGSYSALVSNRNQDWHAASQNIPFVAGSIYKVTLYIKLLETADSATYQDAKLTLTCTDAGDVKKYLRFGRTPQIVPGEWRKVGGALRIPAGYHTCSVYLQTKSPAEYLVDEASAVLESDDVDWKTKARARIDEHRKSAINIKFKSPRKGPQTTVELTQTQIAFPMGSAIGAAYIVDSAYTAYQDAFYNNFNWAVIENKLKWKQTEWNEGNIDYDTALTAMNALLSNGIKARCHCTFWAKDDNVQDWVKALYGDDLRAAISERIQGVIGATKGMCEHWDVNNENLHGDFYERQTGDVNITMDMFRQIRAVDPKPELYLNDFGVVSGADSAVALGDVAIRYKAAGVPLGGIGVQSHLKNFDVHLIKARLDMLAEAGLPIMITEFSVNDKNATSKAKTLDDILTLMFSLSYVKGILIWGFWDGKIWEPDAALYEGENVTANAAGLAYENLFHNEWRTKDSTTVGGKKSYTVGGFKGTYTLTIKQGDTVLKTSDFTLSDKPKKINIRVTKSGKAKASIK